MNKQIRDQVLACKAAAYQVASLSGKQKNQILADMAESLIGQKEQIKQANQKDLNAGEGRGLSAAMLDRLALDDTRIDGMAGALQELIHLPDPVGKTTAGYLRPNGLHVSQMHIPIGVIMMIYESRPNVTVEASGLCFKSGNVIILRGGSEAFHSNIAIASCLRAVLQEHGLPAEAIQFIETTDRSVMDELLTMSDAIDLVIPRGGTGLIEYVSKTSRIPVIQHFKGVCHLYIDESADLVKAEGLLINGKAQRPGVCNALETCLIHESVAEDFLKKASSAITHNEIEVRGCDKTQNYLSTSKPATDEDYHAEYLAKIIAMKVVSSMDEAIEHIQNYGSNHTEVICTESYTRAEQFVNRINSSVVMVNASSRFSDGGELGLGAEIGISTSKLHAYGPMGLDALTTKKFVVKGQGQIRS